MDEEMIGDSGPVTGSFSPSRRQRQAIGHARRLQLLRFAEKIAADVMEQTRPEERCLIRRMVENLLPGED